MNKLELTQTGGFPFNTDRLADAQEAWSIFNALGYLGGEKTIISGCIVNGANTGDGYVFFDGEVLPFVGGATMPTVKLVVETTSKQFQDGQTKPVLRKRYITFASGTGTVPWADFTRLNALKEMQRRILPPGTNPQLYCGDVDAIPSGWQLCNGSNGTPDLRGQFIVGYHPDVEDYNAIGKTGGLEEVELSIQQLPSHKHGGSAASAGDHSHTGLTIKASERDVGNAGNYIITANAEQITDQTNNAKTGNAGAHIHTIAIDNTGGNQAHENRPPYYTLAYIIYIG